MNVITRIRNFYFIFKSYIFREKSDSIPRLAENIIKSKIKNCFHDYYEINFYELLIRSSHTSKLNGRYKLKIIKYTHAKSEKLMTATTVKFINASKVTRTLHVVWRNFNAHEILFKSINKLHSINNFFRYFYNFN